MFQAKITVFLAWEEVLAVVNFCVASLVELVAVVVLLIMMMALLLLLVGLDLTML